MQDFLGDVEPALGALGNAPLVQGQAHYRRAVLFHQGQNGVQHPVLAVDRIDNGLAAVDPQGLLQHRRVGGIQLEGRVRHPLKGLDHPDHNLSLVDARQAHVHV